MKQVKITNARTMWRRVCTTVEKFHADTGQWPKVVRIGRDVPVKFRHGRYLPWYEAKGVRIVALRSAKTVRTRIVAS